MPTPKQLVASFYDAFTANDHAMFASILAPDWVNHPADPGHPNTVEGFLAGVDDNHQAFEDFVVHRDVLISEDEWVVCRITMTGVHVSEFAGHQPSGRRVSFHGMDMHRISDDHIAETWHFERLEELDEPDSSVL